MKDDRAIDRAIDTTIKDDIDKSLKYHRDQKKGSGGSCDNSDSEMIPDDKPVNQPPDLEPSYDCDDGLNNDDDSFSNPSTLAVEDSPIGTDLVVRM